MHCSLKLHLNFTKGINFHVINPQRQILNHISISCFGECVTQDSVRGLSSKKIRIYLWSLKVHGNCSLELATGLFSEESTQRLFKPFRLLCNFINLLKPTGYVMHQQFNIQQLHALPTLYLCVLYLSENKQRLVPLTA